MADGISIRGPKETAHWMQTPVPQHTQTKGATIKTGTLPHYKIRVKRCSKTHRFFSISKHSNWSKTVKLPI